MAQLATISHFMYHSVPPSVTSCITVCHHQSLYVSQCATISHFIHHSAPPSSTPSVTSYITVRHHQPLHQSLHTSQCATINHSISHFIHHSVPPSTTPSVTSYITVLHHQLHHTSQCATINHSISHFIHQCTTIIPLMHHSAPPSFTTYVGLVKISKCILLVFMVLHTQGCCQSWCWSKKACQYIASKICYDKHVDPACKWESRKHGLVCA